MLLTIITFLVVFSIIVFVHELGHFFSARKLGVKVEEFGIGFPPKLKTITKKNGTEYSINWIPFGGFVKLKGMESGESKDKDSFTSKKIWQRTTILSAGVLMNFLLAFVLLSIGFTIGLPAAIGDETKGANVRDMKIQVFSVLDNSPAQKADIKPGDAILSIDGKKFTKIDNLQNYYSDKVNQTVSVAIKRGNQIQEKNITLKTLDESKEAKIGVNLLETGIVSYPITTAFVKGVKTTGLLTWQIIHGIYTVIKDAIVSQKISTDIAGPVGIAVITGQVARLGLIYILQFTAILSLTLAIINFLPFPALDGGRVLFTMIEKVRGRPVNQKVENIIHTFGFYLLLLLLVVISFRDVKRFSLDSAIVNFFKNLVGQ